MVQVTMRASQAVVLRHKTLVTIAHLVLLCCAAQASATGTGTEEVPAALPNNAPHHTILDLFSIAPVSNFLFQDKQVKSDTSNDLSSEGIAADMSEVGNTTENQKDLTAPKVTYNATNFFVDKISSFIEKLTGEQGSLSVSGESLVQSPGVEVHGKMDALSTLQKTIPPSTSPDSADGKTKFRRKTSAQSSPENIAKKNDTLGRIQVPFRRMASIPEQVRKSVPKLQRMARRDAIAE